MRRKKERKNRGALVFFGVFLGFFVNCSGEGILEGTQTVMVKDEISASLICLHLYET